MNKQEKESGGFLKSLPTGPLIFTTAMGFVVLSVTVIVALGDAARDVYPAASDWVTSNLGWLFIGSVSASFIFLIGLLVSRYGRIQLSDDGEEPECTIAGWFGMLLVGGADSMLMFWGVTEPFGRASNPPFGDEPMSREAQNIAMAFTTHHLGIRMWVITALPGLAPGHSVYERHLPLRIPSIFVPLLGARIYLWPSRLINAVAIINTVIGIAVSVSMGALQINSGTARVIDTPENSMMQLVLIAIIIVIASIFVTRGLNKDIRVLSNVNIWVAMTLMIFVLPMSPTLTLLRQTVDMTGVYLDTLPHIVLWADSYDVSLSWKQGA